MIGDKPDSGRAIACTPSSKLVPGRLPRRYSPNGERNKAVLEATYQQDFRECSYGYRLGVGAKEAVGE